MRATANDEVDDHKPRRLAAVIECEVGDELLIYAPQNRTAVALNSSARAVWNLCRDDTSVAGIASSLGTGLGLPADALLPDVRDVIARLCAFGVLAVNGD